MPSYEVWLLILCPKSRRAPIALPGTDTGAKQRSPGLQPIPAAVPGPWSFTWGHSSGVMASSARQVGHVLTVSSGSARGERTKIVSEGCCAPSWHSIPVPSTASRPALSLLVLGVVGVPQGSPPPPPLLCCGSRVTSGWVEVCPVSPPPASVTSCHAHTSAQRALRPPPAHTAGLEPLDTVPHHGLGPSLLLLRS